MDTSNKKNSVFKNHNSYDRNNAVNDEFFDLDRTKETKDSNEEIANRGYTVRDGHNPNKPNPDEDDLDLDDDLNDDFHTDRDLEDNNDVYEVELEDEDAELDIDGNELNEVNDELDNPSDDFNETEDDLEDLDDDDEDDEGEEYIEDDVQR
ncbi:hypothetical protein [Flavobacterium chilense]|uniref:Uncharacterized protein n=1 Tax=Flavobacterium chilense TaxID=946677 RepID=A0A1M6ZD23_9FLAO|nr:hypothetical protein [Flavobacterium chilense]SHL28254.1 hypothetical protein SAMN05444484_101970 [Flavobacterium chilense]